MKEIDIKFMSFNDMQEIYPDYWILVANPVSEPASVDIKGDYFLYKKKVVEKSTNFKIKSDIDLRI